jgi:hypothetical protein
MPLMHTFVMTPEQGRRTQGLQIVYRSPERTWTLPEGHNALKAPAEADFPVTITGRGQVWAAVPGNYGFRARGARATIHDRSLEESGFVHLPAGWHTIEVELVARDSSATTQLEWRRPESTAWEPIEREFLNTHPRTHGLLGRYIPGALPLDEPEPLAGETGYAKLDIALSFDWQEEPDEEPPPVMARRPSTMEWVGTIAFPEGTHQTVFLDTTTPAKVFVNGEEVVAASGGFPSPPVQRTFVAPAGRVPIVVRTVRAANDRPGFWRFRLLWRQPGGGWTAFADYAPPRVANPAREEAIADGDNEPPAEPG